jgi:UDP-N-acetylglucosamine 1-carboxyvinyltransferase
MNAFEVIGGNKLSGEIIPQGAKNEALQIISAVLLTKEKVSITNIPDIIDVNLLIDLLIDMGVTVERTKKDTCIFEAKELNIDYVNSPVFKTKSGKLRGAVMLAGPMLGRFKTAFVPKPGGDKIGRRRLDTHMLGFEQLGAKIVYDATESVFQLNGTHLKAAAIVLEEPSLTGTANIVMAAVLTPGVTTIYNSACEPYLQQLCRFLNSMGARIGGIGSNLLTVEGVVALGTGHHRLLPDMIEVGSFIGLAAMTQSDITIKQAGIKHLGIIPQKFQQLGIHINFNEDDIHIPSQPVYEVQQYADGGVLTIYDHPWPGFTPDLISIILVTAIQARGSVLIHQKMFESRLFFVDKLIDMGAKIILCDPHRAVVVGLERRVSLRGITMSSPDIRAGVALLIAALSAEGKSIIQNIEQIDRGYQQIDTRLAALGAHIKRIHA